MVTEIKVPDLGESITEATVANWLVKPGERVEADRPLLELETDKATLEVPAPASGVLSEILVPAGEDVEVGALLGRIDDAVGGGESTRAGADAGAGAKDGAKVKAKADADAEAGAGANGKRAAARGRTADVKTPGAAGQGGGDEDPAEAATAVATPEDAARKAAAASGSEDGPTEPPSGDGSMTDITVPGLGESITEATVARWLVAEGGAVRADQPLLELETDKATLEVPAPASGVLAQIVAADGADVEVGALLGRIRPGAAAGGGAPGTGSGDGNAAGQGGEATPPDARASGAAATESRPAAGGGSGPASPHRDAPEPAVPAAGLDPTRLRRSGASGKVSLGDLLAFLGLGSEEALSRSGPAVRKLVADRGVDPATLPATGPHGRITKEDVLSGPETGAAAPRPREHRVRMTRMRRTIAARLKEAQNTAAILTSFNECDMSRVIALRTELKDAFPAAHGVKLGFMSFFVKAAVHALREVPEVNARIDDKEIVFHDRYDVGMAVSTPNGLVVPVIRDADGKTHAGIERTLADLAARARDNKLALDEMEGGTFSITNGGVFGSLVSTPILNLPQSGILGLHKIQDRPVAVDGEVVVRPMMYIALSYDHRLVDGREAVTFLVKVKEAIENPERPSLDR